VADSSASRRAAASLRKIQGLDEGGVETRLIHEPARLRIVSALAVGDTLTFADLKAQLELSDGNLSVHARKLEEGGLITCTKSFAGRVPRTEYRLTAKGKKALDRYLDHMEALIRQLRDAE
jgi:DNA-binding transcriptional ArsR family regulator